MSVDGTDRPARLAAQGTPSRGLRDSPAANSSFTRGSADGMFSASHHTSSPGDGFDEPGPLLLSPDSGRQAGSSAKSSQPWGVLNAIEDPKLVVGGALSHM